VQYDVPRGGFNVDIDMGVWGGGNWTGIITGLRIDPAMACGSGSDPFRFYNVTVQR
jgi:hypothetical protein